MRIFSKPPIKAFPLGRRRLVIFKPLGHQFDGARLIGTTIFVSGQRPMGSHPIVDMASGALPIVVRVTPASMSRAGLWRDRKQFLHGRALKLDPDSKPLAGDGRAVRLSNEEQNRRKYHPLAGGIDSCLGPQTWTDVRRPSHRPAFRPALKPPRTR